MTRLGTKWYSPRVQREVTVVRWGEVGAPVLLFPTAGGDAEEVERFFLIRALAPLLEQGRVKVYSVDSVAGQAWLAEDGDGGAAARIQNAFLDCVYHEVVPAIRMDCRSPDVEITAAGASIGAFNSLASLCLHPDAFARAICMSGTYDLRKLFHGRIGQEYYQTSPLDFVPHLGEGPHLDALRRRFVLLAHGDGRWEEPSQSWRAADVLGARGIPNRVDAWGSKYDHDWQTWREMLPHYLGELLPS